MKNAIIALLAATTIIFGYLAFFPTEDSEDQLRPDPVEPKSEILEEYINEKFFNQNFIAIKEDDKFINVDSFITEYHTQVLPELTPRNGKDPRRTGGNRRPLVPDKSASMFVMFDANEVRKLIDSSKAKTIFIHHGAYYYSLAVRDSIRSNRKLSEYIYKPTLIMIAKSGATGGFTGGSYYLAGQICPPPKGCLK